MSRAAFSSVYCTASSPMLIGGSGCIFSIQKNILREVIFALNDTLTSSWKAYLTALRRSLRLNWFLRIQYFVKGYCIKHNSQLLFCVNITTLMSVFFVVFCIFCAV